MNVADALGRSRCFRGLDKAQLKDFLQMMELRPFQRGQQLWREGDHTTRVAFVVAGRVKLVRHRASGKDLIINLLGPGQLVEAGLTSHEGLMASVIGMAQGVLATIDRTEMLALMRHHPTVAVNVALELARGKEEMLFRFDEIASGSVESRLASLLLRLADDEGEEDDDGGVKLTVPLSRQDLADLVDTTIETAIRVMSRWNRDRLVVTEKDGFLIPDLEALEMHTE